MGRHMHRLHVALPGRPAPRLGLTADRRLLLILHCLPMGTADGHPPPVIDPPLAPRLGWTADRLHIDPHCAPALGLYGAVGGHPPPIPDRPPAPRLGTADHRLHLVFHGPP